MKKPCYLPRPTEAKYELAKLRIETGQYEQAKEFLLKMIRESLIVQTTTHFMQLHT